MINNASRAFPTRAMPALVALLLSALLSAPGTVHASEGTDAPAALPARLAAPATAAPAAAAPAVVIAAPAAATAPAAAAGVRRLAPAPRPIAAGPVWTDASGAWRQVGSASWYGGSRWQGKLTASGVRYDERLLTAAHASRPIGSVVRVTVADTGRSVIVTINDRPGTRKRIIDLSRAAAIELGILSRGIAQVTLTPT